MTTTTTNQTVTVLHTNQYSIRCIARVDMPDYGIVKDQVFFLRRVSAGVYEVRKLATLNRVELTNGSIECTVQNGDEKQYTVTLNRNKQHTCTCDAYTKKGYRCYHVTYCRYTENARVLAVRASASQKVTQITNLENKGVLNGNKSFSILKQAS